MVQLLDTSVKASFVSIRELLSGLHLALDLVFELSHVEHELVHLGGPHGQLLDLHVLSEGLLLSDDALLAPLMTNVAPSLVDPLEHISVDAVARVGGDSLLLLLVLDVLLPEFDTDPVVEESVLHLEEPVHAAQVLLLELVKVESCLLLLLDRLNELADVGLLLVQVHLVVVLIVIDVALLHYAILLHELSVELLEEAAVRHLKLLLIAVVVLKLDLLSDYSEMREGIHAGLLLLVNLAVPCDVAGHVFGSNDGLVACLKIVLDLVHYMALDVLAHILVLFSDGAWRCAPTTSLLFDFINSLVVMVMSLSSATLVAVLDMGAQPSA